MKKFILCLSLCLLVLFFAAPFSYAADDILESPNVKIIIDGKTDTYTDVPIILNGRTLLPLRAVLTNLGVQNDDQHIIWNGSEQSVTIYKNSTKIYLKVNSKEAYVNDAPVILDVSPILYKGRTYIPARFVAQSLGKKVVWDGSLNAVLIRDESEFNKIKEILDKSDAAMNSLKKAKFNMDMNMSMAQTGFNMNFDIGMRGEVDKTKKVMYLSMNMPFFGQDKNIESYFSDNMQYTMNPLTGEWEAETLPPEEYEELFNENDNTSVLDVNDALCAGLLIANGANTDEILLKGNVYMDEILNKANKDKNISEYKIVQSYIEISINKNTYLVNKLYMDMNGTMVAENAELQFSAKVTCTYSDLNGDFEIILPDFDGIAIPGETEQNTL
jgi:hypothetical protein